ncbi:MAG: hypothetical protein AAGE99_05125, partial [Chlamydiota bacterium]
PHCVHTVSTRRPLPVGWLKYESRFVLTGALRVIMKQMGKTELVGKNATVLKSFPALDYEYYTIAKENQRETAGTLILVENVLYKVEMTYPVELGKQVRDHLAYFIASFTPEKGEVISSQPENSESDTPQSPQ